MRAIGRLGRELARERGEDSVLHRVAGSVAEAMRVPYVAVREADRTTVVSYGTAVGDAPLHEVPLRYAGRSVGTLLVARRTPGAGLSAADRALLELVAGPVGIAVHAARLADDLAVSQQHVLAATEEERTRLRRDLHDGLGPSLSGMALGLEATQLARDDTVLRDELLTRLRDEVRGAVIEVRRKPWRVSTSIERLDARNGLTACPTHDVAFDTGLLTVKGVYAFMYCRRWSARLRLIRPRALPSADRRWQTAFYSHPVQILREPRTWLGITTMSTRTPLRHSDRGLGRGSPSSGISGPDDRKA